MDDKRTRRVIKGDRSGSFQILIEIKGWQNSGTLYLLQTGLYSVTKRRDSPAWGYLDCKDTCTQYVPEEIWSSLADVSRTDLWK